MKNQVEQVRKGKVFRRQVKGFKVKVEDADTIPRIKQPGLNENRFVVHIYTFI